MSRATWDETFAEMLKILAKRSSCLKYTTATLITHDTQIVSIGYNGTSNGSEECIDYWKKQCPVNVPLKEYTKTDEFKTLHRPWSKIYESHAESNALRYINKRDIDDSYTLYTLYSPCDLCAKEIISYGIKHIKYLYKYPSGENALNLLKDKNISCIQMK